ncbi:MAG: hypothetical protein B6242_01550 [Anaerolineaceae bacterium 4572_78]|nr:MAG: hypothetical protein B6242_01550 [Anaerolineaceae bacterium 4572_78]
MRYLVISDIHANLIAFETVLQDSKDKYDKIWCLGDVVGYGPHPNECVELLSCHDHLCLAGNHDWAVINRLNVDDFNPNAKFAVLWTREIMTTENLDYLAGLPDEPIEQESHFTLVHASPRHPIWEYVLYPRIAQLNFAHFQTNYCFVGHTHSPIVFVESQIYDTMCDAIIPTTERYLQELDVQRLIINPGSVGQPRDGDPRASYGILDTDKMEFEIRRVEYNVTEVQDIMKQYNFPPRLWSRLKFGF